MKTRILELNLKEAVEILQNPIFSNNAYFMGAVKYISEAFDISEDSVCEHIDFDQKSNLNARGDAEALTVIKELIDQLIGEAEPSDEDLDFNDAAIQVYADLHNLKESLDAMGIGS